MRKLLFFIFIFLFPINVFAKSYIVMDVDSGRVLESSDSHNKLLIASTTKIMTCIVTLENAQLDKEVTVGDEIDGIDGTNIYITKGEKIKIIDLLYGLMLRSGNDASMVLSYNVFEDYNTFISKMNEYAEKIGMKDTIFHNPHGLDDQSTNKSTAYDLALLGQYAYKNELFRKIISTKKYLTSTNIKSYAWYNRVSILNNYKYSTGGKNGYTPKAGKALVSFAEKDGLKLVCVSLDDSDIYETHKKLFNKVFDNYKKYIIVDKNKFYIDSSLINEDVYLKKSFSYPLKEDELDKVSTFIKVDNDSRIIIKLGDKEIGNIKLYKKKVNKKKEFNLFQWFSNLFTR